MNFAELRFWGLLGTGLGLILLLRLVVWRFRRESLDVYDRAALATLGLALLAAVSWVTLLIFAVVAMTSYIGVKLILRHDPTRSKRYLAILLPLQLMPLLYYKYGDFLTNSVLDLNVAWLRGLVIPVGISFYTFQKVAFVLDTLALKRPVPRFLDYLNFVAFFPQIVAGPIERRDDLQPQMERFRFRWSPEALNDGATWIAVGLFFKCCLADNLARYFSGASTSNPFAIWFDNLLFGLRIYYDFAGYSLIAVGLARCLGIKLTLNFASPYCATSITDFWRRWHITLSQWFRDYVYIPLGGGRTQWWAFNVLAVFAVSGFWHGAGWNFLWWGLLHGMFLVVNRFFAKYAKVPGIVGWALTMCGSFFAWLFFYEVRTPVLIAKVKTVLTPGAYHLDALRALPMQWPSGQFVVLGSLLVLASFCFLLELLSVYRQQQPYFYLRQRWATSVLVALTVILAPGENNAFIYFAF